MWEIRASAEGLYLLTLSKIRVKMKALGDSDMHCKVKIEILNTGANVLSLLNAVM